MPGSVINVLKNKVRPTLFALSRPEFFSSSANVTLKISALNDMSALMIYNTRRSHDARERFQHSGPLNPKKRSHTQWL
eukprot:CAMPEP_0171715104 /NCGR_PEP_ID=MMETSP0991-20121206/18680_1 /TAXON_ID=483369 /ORGANISM="non described non described, Strain CCMP2098" /LENGTH=77 /DNA_ID=CAMNT_0012305949 /DNA_START=149 /DNA_END=378 /DNA_ORIENTATION=-